MSADRKPQLLSWSAQYQADLASVDSGFAQAQQKLVDLLPRQFEKFPAAFKVRRGKDVFMEETAGKLFDRAEVELTSTADEVTTAPEDMQRLFLDLGIKPGDELVIEFMAAKRNWRPTNRRLAEQMYSVTLMPTVYRPDLVGIKFNSAKQLWFLKPGTSVSHPESANTWYESKRIREMAGTYDLLEHGLTHNSHEVGTHASYTEYEQKPHPYLATIHRVSADWIVSLVDKRIS